jgi:diadenylate cyclase
LGALDRLRDTLLDMAERFAAYIGAFRIWDIVDILLVTVIIYFAIQLMRRSSAFSVMKGIIVLVLVLVLSGMLDLHTLNFLLYSTLQVGVLAAIVLFQPEFRKVLGQMGTTANLPIGRGEASTLEKCIANTVEACRDLSWQRQGALIVLERRDPLDDYVETGTVIDAAVSADLLKNIFYPKAPLHDGAVIIRGGRVTGAGCMLPLTSNQHLNRDLGMRHRAGIGMSENSDAVVVIVSEETGSMSAAVGGMLKRHLAPETLEKLLRLELMPAEPQNGKKGLGGLSDRIRRKGDGA